MADPIITNAPEERDYTRLYKLLIENLKDFAIFAMDPKGVITSWNPGVERILGYSEEEFLGKPLSMIFTPEDVSRGMPDKEREEAARSGHCADERWHLRKDGTRFFVDGVVSALLDDNGKLVGFSKVMRDATRRKLTEMERDRLLQERSAMLASVQEGICFVNLEGNITFVNDAALTLLGLNREQCMGSNMHELCHSTKADGSPYPKEECPVYQTARDRVVRHIEEEVMWRSDGAAFATEYSVAPVIVGERVEGMIVTFRDVSERKRNEVALKRSNEELSHFAHVVSHDLQAPLRSVRSYTQLLGERYLGKLDEPADEFIQFILDGASNMDHLIRALLQFAQAGQDGTELKPARIEEVLETALLQLESDIEATGAVVTHDKLPVIYGDFTQLVQLFQNLIGNALKYRSGEPPRIHIGVSQPANEWRFSVKDNGMGIDPRYHERIFVPLKRLHGHDIPGTGIGLSICKKIVERMGGRLWVDSDGKNGSTFFFTIPSKKSPR